MAPTPTEIPTYWSYPLTSVTENKRTNRTGVPKTDAYELVGAAGDIEGGVSPFQGLKLLTRLDFQSDPHHSASSRVTEHFSVHLTVGYDGYMFGFVYRAIRPADLTTGDIFVDYWNSKTSTWTRGSKLVDGVDADATWKYEGAGRIGYVYIRGRSPVRFYLDRDSPYTLNVLGQTLGGDVPGPGARPTCIPVPDVMMSQIGSVEWVDDPVRPGYGQVFLLGVSPWNLKLGNFSGSGSGGGSGSGPCQGAPGYQHFDDPRAFPPGAYAYAYQLLDSRTGLKSAISEIGWANTADWGSYSSAWMALEVAYDSTKFDQMIVYRSIRLESGGGAFAGSVLFIEDIIDLQDYWTCKTRPGGTWASPTTNFRHVVYFYKLEDKQLVNQPMYLDDMLYDQYMPFGGEALFYEGTMIVSRISGSNPSTVDQNRPFDPTISNGELRWSSLQEPLPELFSPSSRRIPSIPSSDPVALRKVAGNCIGLGKDRQFHIRKEADTIRTEEIHEGYGVVGPKALDSFGSVLYFVTPKGLKAVDTQAQLDSVRSMDSQIIEGWSLTSLEGVSVACDPTASCMFVFNPTYKQAMVLWFNSPSLTEVHDLEATEVRRSLWSADPDDETTTLVERATFLVNRPGTSANLAGLPTDYKPGIYAMDFGRTKTVSGSGTSSFNGEPRVTLLDFDGDSIFTVGVGGFPNAAVYLPVSLTGKALPPVERDLTGARLYVLWSATSSLIGKTGTIMGTHLGNSLTMSTEDLEDLWGLAAGDIVGISPIYFRWVGAQLPMEVNGEPLSRFQNEAVDFFRVKQAESLRVAFSDVTGTPMFDPTSDTTKKVAYYRGLVYTGNDASPVVRGIPSAASNNSPVQSVMTGGGRNACNLQKSSSTIQGKMGVVGGSLSPGIEIYCPDLSYKVLGVRVKGKILGTDREQLAS